MKAEWWEKIDVQALKEVRRNKPPSRAREARYYKDPALSFELESARKRKSEAKKTRNK
jgi:hypothetical protein